MATSVSTTEDVQFQDGTEATLKSATISNLRKIMKRTEEFVDANDEDEFFEMILNSAAFCLHKQRPEFYDENKNNGENRIKGGASEKFEDAVDLPTVYKILEICGGIKLNDPNLLAAATNTVLGMNSTS